MDIEVLLKIFLSAVLGGIIGLEREMSQKSAGLRTNILIAVGSALVTLLSFKMVEIWKTSDPTRLTAHLITAVGFIGGGTIIKERFSVNGLTTAATIWTVAAIGITVGSGFYMTAFIVTLLVLVILNALRFVTTVLGKHSELYPYVIASEDRTTVLIDIKRILRDLGIKYLNARLRKVVDGYEIEIELITSETKNEAFMERVMQTPGVKEITGEHL